MILVRPAEFLYDVALATVAVVEVEGSAGREQRAQSVLGNI